MSKYWAKFAVIKQKPECDFCCCNEEIYHSYQAEDFIINKSDDCVSESKGAWAACKTCYDLIEVGKWKELLDRSCHSFVKKYKFNPPDLRFAIGKIHELFRQHMRRSA